MSPHTGAAKTLQRVDVSDQRFFLSRARDAKSGNQGELYRCIIPTPSVAG